MFNRCWRWNALLARRAEGELSPAQLGMLQSHLAECARCRALTQADDAVHDVLAMGGSHMETARTRAFDDYVVAALAANPHSTRITLATAWPLCRNRTAAYCRTLSHSFLAQVGGGAVIAASLTCFFLLPALHSGPILPGRTGLASEKMARDTAERSLFPVPMETLLNTHSPRAAMLWTVPERRPDYRAGKAHADLPASEFHLSPAPLHGVPSRMKPAPLQPSSPPSMPEKHSALDAGKAFG